MKFDITARRETLMLEREKISHQIRVQCRDHEKIMERLQGDLQVIDARLEEIENFAASLGPDFSGRTPIAGTVEPIQRRPKRDLLALTLDYVQKYPGNSTDWLALTIEQNTKIRTLPQPIRNKLEHLKVSGYVRCDDAGEDDTWWPTENHPGGSGDTEATTDGNHG